MIRLGKDKTLDNYFIDENGVITDSNGNVQKTKKNVYEWFKGEAVHRIQLWTNYGYRDTKIWVIHHLDNNKFNNRLSNLKFMTFSQHTKLHHKGKITSDKTKQKMSVSSKGNHLSDEARAKISIANKGKKLSKETKRKMSISKTGEKNSSYGKKWYTNGMKNIYLKVDEQIPLGFYKGMTHYK